MQDSLSIENRYFPIQTTKEIDSVVVPFEVQGFQKDFTLAKTTGGFFDLSGWPILEIAGKDAQDYLQRMTTCNFKDFKSSDIRHGAFLTGKGGVVALGMFQKVEEGKFHFVVTPNQKETALEHIEKFHFQEVFTVIDRSSELALVAWWNPQSSQLKELTLENLKPLQIEWRRWQSLSFDLWRDDSRPSMYWFKLKRAEASQLMFEWGRLGVSLLGQRLFDYFRVEAGVPAVGAEVSEKDIILETGFEQAVARNKGCYPGQEVVERIYTYGQVNRKLLRVNLELEEGGELSGLPQPFGKEDNPAGVLVTAASCPEDPKKAIGLAYVRKGFWESHETFSVQTQLGKKAQLSLIF